jgi:hypothetical protein
MNEGRIRLTLPNVLLIGAVAGVFTVGALGTIHYLSHKDVPLASPTARGVADVIKRVAA